MILHTNTTWFTIPQEQVLALVNTSLQDGLTHEEAQKRIQEFGKNVVIQKKAVHPLILFLQQFNQPLVYMLLGAVVITALLKEWSDSIVIFGVVLVNAIIGYVQESKALQAIASLAKSMVSTANVIRNGEPQLLPAEELTLGDIVVLRAGDKVPADLRLIQVRELQVDESAFTGESIPVQKQTDPLPAQTILAERSNMAYSSTLVTYGIAIGTVVAIGNQTEVGKINQLIASADILATPLTKKIAKFSTTLLYVILGLSLVTFAVGILRGYAFIDMFMAVVALAVGAIPEGLPAALTITLAIGVAKLAKKNAIIRKLPAVETLGSTSVICSDKTGTLTENQMTVEKIFADEQFFEVTGAGYEPKGEITSNKKMIHLKENLALRECLLCGLLCNEAKLVSEDGVWKIEGDPTEGAMITLAEKVGLSKTQMQSLYPRIDTIPFESEYQYMATLHQQADGSRIIYLKGSVESILARCQQRLDNKGDIKNFDTQLYHQKANAMANSGLRVLAFAMKKVHESQESIKHEDVAKDLIFLGMQGMIDPPRPETYEAVATCQKAGITVKMITGDHALTALAIAQKIGIVTPLADKEAVLTGKEISQLSDKELEDKVKYINVFARVAPSDKLRIVKALQANDAVISMTGDGVNDAPSLRQANIGIAMGITGTDVAKETADMILTDDNFATIKAAVEEGRGVYDNLIKFITWTLPTNLGEGFVIMTAILLGVALPILPIQILWINMTTAILLGLMLAFEPKEKKIMQRKPRKPNEPILSKQLIIKIVVVGIFLCVSSFWLYHHALQDGVNEDTARTLAVNIFVFGEMFYLFNCRSLKDSVFKIGFFSNRFLLLGVILMILLQLAFTYLPIMNQIFHSAPISLVHWGHIIGASFLIFIIIEIEKILEIDRKVK
ncbi:MAG: cation-transporting P-type ATPase [Thermoflexibacter sp.]